MTGAASQAVRTPRRAARRLHARFALVCAGALFLALAGGARAQRGVDSELFRPALDGYGIFTVERAQTSHQWDFGFKLYANYAQNPLRLAFCPAGVAGCSVAQGQRPSLAAVMNFQAALNLGMHLGLTNWLELVADLPFSGQGYSSLFGDNGSPADAKLPRTGFYANGNLTNVGPPRAAPLDWRLGLKARLFRAGPFGMALAAVVTLPFGDDSAFLGDQDFTFRPTLIGDFTRGALTFALNLGAIIRSETVVRAPNDPAGTPVRSLLDVSHELTFSAGLAYRFARWAGVAGEVFGYLPVAGSASGPLDAPRDYTADILAGLQLFPVRDVSIGVGAGTGLVGAASRHDDFRVFLGLSWAAAEAGNGALSPGGADRDHDGIPDALDQCPNDPEDRDGFEDDDGCPDLDNDRDGMPDSLDRCPNDPEDRDGFQDDDGCPDPDNDGDGIPDPRDRCPNEAEDRDGFQDDDGCPDPDNDGDGIADANDKCPNEPETRNGVNDEDGCPDSGGQVTIVGGKIELPENITFEPGSDQIIVRSQAVLLKVAEKLRNNPRVKRVRIEGHSDDPGSPRKNEELSQLRAEAVRNFLVRRGVEPERVQAVGYGNARPLDPRRTPEARAINRRVDFIIVDQ